MYIYIYIYNKVTTYFELKKVSCNQSSPKQVYKAWHYNLKQGTVMVSDCMDLASVYSVTVGKFVLTSVSASV